MKCNLCNKNTRCSCKGGGCPGCNSTNKQVTFINDLLKFGLDREIITSNLKDIKIYADKVDSFTTYEYLNNEITEEEFNKAIEEHKAPVRKPYTSFSKDEIKDVSNKVNPSPSHKFLGASPWSRCEYCWGIKKYVEKEKCPAYNREIPVSTEDKND